MNIFIYKLCNNSIDHLHCIIILLYIYAVTIHKTCALSAYVPTCMVLIISISQSIILIIISDNTILHDVIKEGSIKF